MRGSRARTSVFRRDDMPNHELPGPVESETPDHKKTDKPKHGTLRALLPRRLANLTPRFFRYDHCPDAPGRRG